MALSPGMQPSPGQAACQGATKGAFTGLVLGILMGCWEEKRFVMRNCLKEYHLRECPTRLFAVMIRAVTTAPAGAVRTLLSEAALAMHPVVHAQRSVAAGLAAAGVFGLGGWLEQEEDRQKQQRQQWEQQIGMSDCD
ncbi:expressed protein [Chlorella variabilis]|uniref:Expressed protein n=1 Tax=Chlorella variabilis TaxID=554065 RepID=E1ZHQ8_CHLVA|nr:expressed protein [Chlorella variabilis]EFN54648.1 expressed protein [Chlorella variabilis]|eukprot:XP_005846750.1 expressed protein [Chlorella variabilis]